MREEVMLNVRVAEIREEAEGIKSFVLTSVDDTRLPVSMPGAHIDVHVGPGLVRQYSLCNGPEERDHYSIAVKREPASRGGSAGMHQRLRQGDVVRISEPRNTFPLAVTSGRHLLLGGGIGITPLLSMAKHLSYSGEDYELHYFSRSKSSTAFMNLFTTEHQLRHRSLHIGLSPEALPAHLSEILATFLPTDHAYVCGPPPFMELASLCAHRAGLAPGHLHLEYFASEPTANGEVFEVELARTGRRITVQGDQTILEAVRQVGVELESSCEQGFCGTCITAVLQGQPDHRDECLSEQERASGKVILPCVSRAKTSRLVLDL